MELRRMGRSGLEVSAYSLGSMTFGYPTDKKESLRIIARALDAGITLIDSAVVYPMRPPFGVSEEIIGEALKGKRDKVLISTKIHPGRNSRLNIMRNVEESLRRLQTDYIDLYMPHSFDENTPIEETLETLTDLVRQGKVRYVGCSNFSTWQLAKSLWVSDSRNLCRFVVNQIPYNLLFRKVEEDMLPLCQEQGVGIYVYSPRAGGFLTGRYRAGEKPPAGSRYDGDASLSGYGTPDSFQVVEELSAIAREKGCSVTQLATAWVAHQPGVSSVLLGVRTVEQLEEGLEAAELELSAEEVERISALTDYTLLPGMNWSTYKGHKMKVMERFKDTLVPPGR